MEQDINLIFLIEDNAPKIMYIKCLDAFCFFCNDTERVINKTTITLSGVALGKIRYVSKS
ncbi:hypothetical protein ACQKND_22380 [Viridibacillus arvi]|uniref:hypothetical protein n=1 Tax=Viridibacillus arvi TaxID=263475 RepID=UPI003CFE0199